MKRGMGSTHKPHYWTEASRGKLERDNASISTAMTWNGEAKEEKSDTRRAGHLQRLQSPHQEGRVTIWRKMGAETKEKWGEVGVPSWETSKQSVRTLKHRGEQGWNETGQAKTRKSNMRKTSKYELGTPDRRMPVAIFLPSSSFLRLVLPPKRKERGPGRGARARTPRFSQGRVVARRMQVTGGEGKTTQHT